MCWNQSSTYLILIVILDLHICNFRYFFFNYFFAPFYYRTSLLNRYWIKRLSLFGGNWKSQISQIDIGINDYIHKDHKNQIGLVFQLFVYILQQFKWNLLKKQVLWKASALNKNYLTEVSRNQFLYKFS